MITKKIIITVFCFVSAVLTSVAASPVQDIVDDVRRQMVPDKRQGVYEVEVATLKDGSVRLTGKVSDRNVYDTLNARVKAQKGVRVDNRVTLLPDTLWGIIRVSVGSMRTAGKYSAELATQAIMGMPVRLLEKEGGWWRIQSPDGYLGWVWRASIAQKTPEEMAQWRAAPRLVVTSLHQVQAYDSPSVASPRNMITDLVPGSIVEGTLDDITDGKVKIVLPDGRKAWADAKAFKPIEHWAAQDFNPDVILDQAYALEGAPYLWGGTSAKATDCSGLVKVSYYANGLILRRDASQQALIGTHLEPQDWPSYQPADLMFFGERPGGRVTHVALYDADGMFIHCAGLVHRSSIDPKSPDYVDRVFFGGSRIHGSEGSDGITYVRDHPWYF